MTNDNKNLVSQFIADGVTYQVGKQLMMITGYSGKLLLQIGEDGNIIDTQSFESINPENADTITDKTNETYATRAIKCTSSSHKENIMGQIIYPDVQLVELLQLWRMQREAQQQRDLVLWRQ